MKLVNHCADHPRYTAGCQPCKDQSRAYRQNHVPVPRAKTYAHGTEEQWRRMTEIGQRHEATSAADATRVDGNAPAKVGSSADTCTPERGAAPMKRTTALLIPLALMMIGACGPGQDAPEEARPPTVDTAPDPGPHPELKRPLPQRDPATVRTLLEANGVAITGERVIQGTAAGDFASTVWTLAPSGIATVRQFNSGATQAKAIGFGDGLIYWTWDNLTISVTEGTPPATIDAVARALATEPNAPLRLDKRV